MQLRYRQQVTAAGVSVVALALTLGACSSSSSSSTPSGGSSSSSSSSSGGSANLSGTLNGSGSTLQLVYEQAAISAFKSVQSGMTVNYGGGGSGKGRTDLASGVVQFAGSDSPIPAKEASNFKGKTVLYYPILIAPITVSYNLSGVSNLKLSGPTIAGIFSGKIKTWNDPAIKADNSGREPAQHLDHHRPPLGLLGHHRQLLPVPRGGRGERLDARQQLGHQLARHQPGRQRQRRGVADHQVHPRGHRVRGLRRRQGLRADLRFDQEQGRPVRRAVGVGGLRRRQPGHRQARPDVQRDLGARRRARTRSPLSRGFWSTRTSPSANTAKLLQAYIGYLVGDGQQLLSKLGYAPLPSNIDQQAKAELSKIGT